MTDKEFVQSLSEAKAEEAAAIEAEIHQILKDGFTEGVALMFVRAVMAIRDIEPASTVGGVYDTALRVGLREVIAMLLADRGTKRKTARRTGGKLR
ncbi:MAG: hypothetical protein ABSG84_05335 [Acidobacteriaceae bacterium]|jgi:hypothetical protein